MEDFVAFRKMVTPVVIQVVFWIGVIVAVVGALATMFRGNFLAGLVALILGPLLVRIYCELIIVVFKMHESLVEIQKNTTTRA